MLKRYYPTKHAVMKMAQRGITWEQVLNVLTEPEVTYATSTGRYVNADTHIEQRGDLYVVVANSPKYDRHDEARAVPLYAVVTVGLRAEYQWTDEDVRNRTLKKKEDR